MISPVTTIPAPPPHLFCRASDHWFGRLEIGAESVYGALAGEELVTEPAVAGGGGGGAVPVDIRHGSRQDGHRRAGLHLLPRHHQGNNLVWSRLPNHS